MRIFKYPLEVTDTQTVDLPAAAHPLSVQVQDGAPCLWVALEPESPTAPRLVHMVGTGHDANRALGAEFVDTFQLDGGALVFHVFIS